ncbi:MAG TPA: 16S rRNA (adenine(1518)-N(6)/adenine(1519)-N(6))-dimethyltransferase RsmA [Steroidobacteraceae bacterium]|jgi:16S rRNA (adenine1518-N6/adenine1519-N6)-dimethyltransferase|nr:16S rRNA (adenine(1518)-N(6)/adenine(1519)-N(6))-dimethyltransferase RsmA [Steroidobacteraceae bacterium]
MRPAGRGTRPRKRFGQHFLHDPAVIERIAAAIAPASGDALVEIGPGRGALTRCLLESDCASLDAIEIDRDLAAVLRGQWSGDTRFCLHNDDALQVDFGALARERGAKLRVVGNLPYNISTPLLFHLLESMRDISDLHVMLQREVIARMAARAGDSDYGRLTVMLAPWVEVEHLFDVGPGAFHPPPRVWSAVARLVVRAAPAFPVCPAFAAVVAAAFSHRRKTLRNALRGLVTAEQIESSGVDPSVRPETVSPALFNAIAGNVKLPTGAP